MSLYVQHKRRNIGRESNQITINRALPTDALITQQGQFYSALALLTVTETPLIVNVRFCHQNDWVTTISDQGKAPRVTGLGAQANALQEKREGWDQSWFVNGNTPTDTKRMHRNNKTYEERKA